MGLFKSKLTGRGDPLEINQFFFQELGVTRDSVEKGKKALFSELGFNEETLNSFHYSAFVALQLSGFRPRTILELGTFRGQATLFLNKLFPEAELHSVDLPSTDPLMKEFHGLISHETNVVTKLENPNIHLHKMNTLYLAKLGLPDFDLIWLDAGHFFPEVAWDHAFCLAKLKPGGQLLSDDLRLPDNPKCIKDHRYLDVYTTIDYIKQRTDLRCSFLLKRESDHSLAKDPKMIAWLRK
jgi:predicted O-methyltransferase YrrM